MEFKALLKKARSIKGAYEEFNRRSRKPNWTITEYVEGLVGDVGDLAKLTAAWRRKKLKADYKKICHELADCSWSLMAIADELEINLEHEVLINLDYLEQKLYEASKKKK
ncbi:nucleotide pyrophosphohydrolase [Candidatus Parcubacteria bacterium]|nr:nucleotide pyrophosphohydrolase [Candidatus Parcubacteria bacterium]